MKRKANPLVPLCVLSVALLAACSSNDDDGVAVVDPAAGVEVDTDDNNNAGTPVPPEAEANNCPAVGNLSPVDLGNNQCEISGVLTQDAVLSADRTWFLEGGLEIGSVTDNVTLNIDAGTQIRGDNEGATDYVLVYPGSALRANGTSASPVHFLSDDDNVDGRGEWGGVYLRGFNGLDGLAGTQGANLLDYVVVAEAGASASITIDGQTTSYQDNIVLNGVDSSTILTFVQSHNSARDGLHIVNGDPRLSWILATGSSRDGVWYRDFSGLIKDLMVIHDRDADGSIGRSGIYASETVEGNSNPRIVNATLVGRDNSSTSATGPNDREFGILFADNTDQIRMANVLIANFRHGCFEAATMADLSQIDTVVGNQVYIDGIHCANEGGGNVNFGVVRDGSIGFPDGTVARPFNVNTNGIVYYNGAGGRLDGSEDAVSGGVDFTGELTDRTNNFTAGWYLNNIRGISNGLASSPDALHGFLSGDTNNDSVVDAADLNSPFVISDDGEGGFNQDVAGDTGGYDLTHIGAVRGGAITNTQFDGWTVDTGPDDPFTVQPAQ